jgi:NADPH2:quinone reductase
MQRVQLTAFGIDAVEVAEVEDVRPAAGEVLIAAEAMTINPVDLYVVTGALAQAFPSGATSPYTPGWDVAGRVVAVGGGVSADIVGARAVGFSPWMSTGRGTQASLVALPYDQVSIVSGDLPSAQLTTVGLNGLTAWRAVDEVAVRPGETVVVTGAAGSVGGFATELLVARGARVIAAVSERDRDLAMSLGVEAVAAREAGDLGDVVRDLVGGADVLLDTASVGAPALRAVKDGGRYVTVTDLPDAVRGIHVARIVGVADKPALDELVRLASNGGLHTPVARTFPLAQARDAYREFASGAHRGRIVLTA